MLTHEYCTPPKKKKERRRKKQYYYSIFGLYLRPLGLLVEQSNFPQIIPVLDIQQKKKTQYLSTFIFNIAIPFNTPFWGLEPGQAPQVQFLRDKLIPLTVLPLWLGIVCPLVKYL
jgi:hypothetical protein